MHDSWITQFQAMTPWKAPLTPMRRVSANKVLLGLLCLVLLTGLFGCQKESEKTTVQDYLSLVYTTLDLQASSNTIPFYLTIPASHPFFEEIQTLRQYGVLDDQAVFQLEEPLTREFVAYTLMNLYPSEVEPLETKDRSKSHYPEAIGKSVRIGLMQVDQRDCFNPKRSISLEEANRYLNQMMEYLNSQSFTTSHYDATLQEDVVLPQEPPLMLDSEGLTATWKAPVTFEEGDILAVEEEGQTGYYKCEDLVEQDDKTIQSNLSIPSYEEVFQSTDVQTTFDVDFTQATFESLTEDEPLILAEDFGKVAMKDEGTLEVKGFTLKYKATASTLTASVSKKTNLGANLNAEVTLYDVKPTVKWKAEGMNVEDALFKVDFKTALSFGLKRANYKDLYLDYSKIDTQAFLASIQGAFTEKKDVVDEIIPLLKITVPIPSAPVLSIAMTLQLHLYASGRIELRLENTHRLGVEVKNNAIRFVHDVDRDADFLIKASGNAMAGIKMGLETANLALADLTAEGGIKAYLDSKVHLYDELGQVQSVDTPVSTDVLSDVVEGNEDIRVCGDLSAYWQIDLSFNSFKSLLGKLGLRKTFHLLSEKNAQIMPGGRSHIENWQFVEKCTRNNRITSTTKPTIISTDRIKIQDYSLALEVGKSKEITVIGLPSGYGLSDCVSRSLNSAIAQVSGTRVTGVHSGSTKVVLSTKDQKYSVECFILVRVA